MADATQQRPCETKHVRYVCFAVMDQNSMSGFDKLVKVEATSVSHSRAMLEGKKQAEISLINTR